MDVKFPRRSYRLSFPTILFFGGFPTGSPSVWDWSIEIPHGLAPETMHFDTKEGRRKKIVGQSAVTFLLASWAVGAFFFDKRQDHDSVRPEATGRQAGR